MSETSGQAVAQSSTFSWASFPQGQVQRGPGRCTHAVTVFQNSQLRLRESFRMGAARFSFVSQGDIMFIALDSKSVSCLWRGRHSIFISQSWENIIKDRQCLSLPDTQQYDDSTRKALISASGTQQALGDCVTTAIRSQKTIPPH